MFYVNKLLVDAQNSVAHSNEKESGPWGGSELQSVGLVVVSESEAGVEVLSEEGLLGVLDVLQDGSVHGLLGAQSLGRDFLLLKLNQRPLKSGR